jgi:ribulose-phosphate 3-epimerase
MALVSPSMLSADFTNLQKDIDFVNASKADWFHLDIMDGVFVPNISFGLPVVKAIKKAAKKPLDVHLMIVKPDTYIADFKAAGADWLTVHFEACTHLHRTIQAIKAQGMKAGVSLNPHTPVSVLENIICDVDMVLLMSVNPGFGGQKFIPETFDKIKNLKELILRKKSKALIQVDGGVDTSNSQKLVEAGVDVLVAGNAIFSAEDRNAIVDFLKK